MEALQLLKYHVKQGNFLNFTKEMEKSKQIEKLKNNQSNFCNFLIIFLLYTISITFTNMLYYVFLMIASPELSQAEPKLLPSYDVSLEPSPIA